VFKRSQCWGYLKKELPGFSSFYISYFNHIKVMNYQQQGEAASYQGGNGNTNNYGK
jgi:hypothetical protein